MKTFLQNRVKSLVKNLPANSQIKYSSKDSIGTLIQKLNNLGHPEYKFCNSNIESLKSECNKKGITLSGNENKKDYQEKLINNILGVKQSKQSKQIKEVKQVKRKKRKKLTGEELKNTNRKIFYQKALRKFKKILKNHGLKATENDRVTFVNLLDINMIKGIYEGFDKLFTLDLVIKIMLDAIHARTQEYIELKNKLFEIWKNTSQYKNVWMEIVYRVKNLDEDFIEFFLGKSKNKKLWEYILTKQQNLSTKFIEKYIDRMKDGWKKILWNRNLPISFIDKYINKLDLTQIIRHRKLTEDFIEKHKNKLDWTELLLYQRHLKESFLEKHINKINKYGWNSLSHRDNLSHDFLLKYEKKLYWKILLIFNKFSGKFLRQLFEDPNINKGNKFIITYKDVLTRYQELPEKLIDDYFNVLINENIVECQKLSRKFINKHLKVLKGHYWNSLLANQNVSTRFLEKFINDLNEVNWKTISRYQKLPLKFIKKYKNNVDFWELMYKNKKLPKETKQYLYSNHDNIRY